MDKAYDSTIPKVKATLETVERVCTTADVWTANQRSYLGMIVHWIDPTTLKHHKVVISCGRITGCHTHDVLAAKIESFHQSFGLSGKVSATVTDNESNFVKTYTSFVVPDVSSVPESSYSVEDDNKLEEDEVTFVDVVKVMVPDKGDTQDDLTQIEFEVPPHQRCTAHTLNLVANNDVDKFLSSSPLSISIYNSSFGKCTALGIKTTAQLYCCFKSTARSIKKKASISFNYSLKLLL